MMRIGIVNTSESFGGASASAKRLHVEYLRRNLESFYKVQRPASLIPGIGVESPESNLSKVAAVARWWADSLPLKFYPKRQPAIFSPAIVGENLNKFSHEKRLDVLHLHWTSYGFVKIETLATLNLPVVWTLHDSWVFTGGCHLPGDCEKFWKSCGACPILSSSKENDLSRKVWNRKKRTWNSEQIVFVAPSRWMASQAKRSSLLREARVEVLQNGVDTARFKPLDKMFARQTLNLPPSKKLVLFSSPYGYLDKNKGVAEFFSIFERFVSRSTSSEVELVVLGLDRLPTGFSSPVPVHLLGRMQDELSIALVNAACDLIAMTSRSENLPNTLIEAFSAGTPGIAFRVGGIPDIIDHEVNGYLANPFDLDEFSHLLGLALSQHERLGKNARTKAVEHFDIQKQGAAHLELYRSLIERRMSSHR